MLYNLHKKGVPLHALWSKAEEFIAARLITSDHANHILLTIEQFRGANRIVNDGFMVGADGEDGGNGAPEHSGFRLTREQLLKELADRETKLQAGGGGDGVTDQWRVYLIIS